jgi:hypothetical protein
MKRVSIRAFALAAALCAAAPATAQGPYPAMAPVSQYLMAKADEIALARSAAPPSIAQGAEVMVLTGKGYETVVKGANGFVCLVERAWANDVRNDGFWNPRLRGPLCFNPPAARSVMPAYLERTRWVLAGVSKAEIERRVVATIAAGRYTPPAAGAMSFMLSKNGYLGDDAGGPWRPHLMFFQSTAVGGPESWGANGPGAQVLASVDPVEPMVTFCVPVARWSDGTPDAAGAGAGKMKMQGRRGVPRRPAAK